MTFLSLPKNRPPIAAFLIGISATLPAPFTHAAESELEKSWEIGLVPADFRVRFCLLTHGDSQYVAYYDAKRRMTVAKRALDSDQWQYQTLPSEVGWDSHNYLTMAVDSAGHLHLSGNMHADPLIYFRTEKPGDIATLKKFPMTGEREERTTYPKFLTNHEGQLIFNYRDGGSGRGARLYNKYAPETRTWSRLMDNPLLDGEGQRNAYPQGPVKGPNGWFHIIWVWRDTPDCATNHNLSHARSRDLIEWESSFGQKVELPLTIGDTSLLVDPIPSGGGIINGGAKLFFDSKGQPVINYHKSDQNGNMQIYAARPEDKRWKINQLTSWKKPVEFSGRGSMGFIGISLSELSQAEPGTLTMTYHHKDYGTGRLFIDEETLQPVTKQIAIPADFPEQLDKLESNFEGMSIRRTSDSGESTAENTHYFLQWESLGSNYDKPRNPPLPQPSMLRLHKLKKTSR